MNMLKEMIAIERAELLIRMTSESSYVSEKDKDIVLYWVRELLEPLKGQNHEQREQSDK